MTKDKVFNFCFLLNSSVFNQNLCPSPGESDVLQQLSAVSLGDKLKVTVGDNREDGSVALTSDQLSEATLLVSKYHTEGEDHLPLQKEILCHENDFFVIIDYQLSVLK